MYDLETLIAVLRLRRQGMTYREINAELGIPDGRTYKAVNSPLGRFLDKYVA